MAIQAPNLPKCEGLSPLPELTDEETVIWRAVVNSQPADWFDASNAPLLAQYCRHIVQANRIGDLVDRATHDPDGLGILSYQRLLKIQREETAIIKSLATSMRLAQQSTTNHRGNKFPKTKKRPWEIAEE